MSIVADRYMSYKNVIEVSSSAVWVFGEQDTNTQFKQIIVGPIGCKNSIKTNPSFYEFDQVNNDYLNSLNFDERKSMNANIIMHNSGEKDITVDLDHLKLFMKLHVFMLAFHFFTEGLPKYDIDDADLPNQYDDDIENLPKLLNKVYLNNCIVCLDDLKDSIACKMDLCLFYERHNIKSIKEQLLSRVNSHNNPYEDSMICYELRLNIIKCNPYFCKYDDLDGTKSFKKINKREIVKEFALCYSNKNRIEKFDEVKFRINSNTDILVEKVSVKMSIRQIVSFLSMIRNTSRILTEKYTDKIKNDDSLMLERRNPNNSLTKKSLAELSEFTDNIIMVKEANKIKETFDIFSTRYNKVPKRIPKTFEFEDEEEEKHAIDSKAKNIQLLTSSFPARNDEDDLEELKQVTTDEATGRDSFSFFFHGLSIYFINDYKDNFYPVISLDFNDTSYCKNNRTDGSFTSQSQLLANFKYYNVNNGYWEPFVEGLNISFEYDKQSESRVFQVKGKELINLNLSPDFVAVINYCWKSWEQAQKHMNSKSNKEEAKDYFANEDIFSEEAKIRYDSEIKMKDRETIFNLNEEEDIIDIATPYRV